MKYNTLVLQEVKLITKIYSIEVNRKRSTTETNKEKCRMRNATEVNKEKDRIRKTTHTYKKYDRKRKATEAYKEKDCKRKSKASQKIKRCLRNIAKRQASDCILAFQKAIQDGQYYICIICNRNLYTKKL